MFILSKHYEVELRRETYWFVGINGKWQITMYIFGFNCWQVWLVLLFFECVLLPFAILLGMRIAMNTFSRGLGIQNRLGLSPLIKQCIYTWQDNQDVFSIPSLRCFKWVKLFNPIRIVDVTFTDSGFQGSSLCEFQPWTMEHYPFVDGWRMNSMARGFPKMGVQANHQFK
jgi:hypothetical protein